MQTKKYVIPFMTIIFLLGMALEGHATAMNTNQGHRYEIFFGAFTWDEAREQAAEQGYHLATITSLDEQNYVQNLLSDFSGEFWLGAYQDPAETSADQGWSWVTGEAWDYTNWQAGEPNDFAGIQEMHLGMWGNFDWRWNDEHGNSNIFGYVAEIDDPVAAAPVPEPATILLLMSGLAGLGLKGYRRKRSNL